MSYKNNPIMRNNVNCLTFRDRITIFLNLEKRSDIKKVRLFFNLIKEVEYQEIVLKHNIKNISFSFGYIWMKKCYLITNLTSEPNRSKQ